MLVATAGMTVASGAVASTLTIRLSADVGPNRHDGEFGDGAEPRFRRSCDSKRRQRRRRDRNHRRRDRVQRQCDLRRVLRRARVPQIVDINRVFEADDDVPTGVITIVRAIALQADDDSPHRF